MLPTWDEILSFIKALGWTKGVFTIFFFLAHGWIYNLYRDRLKDRQSEINRLATDNREYRERFLSLLDKHFEHSTPAVENKQNERLTGE